MKEKYFKFSVGDMAYYVFGSGKPVVIMHGWGQNFMSFKNIALALKDNYQVIGIDFLGFGLSDEPSNALTVEDYTFHVKTLLEYLGVYNPSIIAHSFGGRVAIKFSSENLVDNLILVSSAGIRHRSIKRFIKVYKYKTLKRIYKLFSKENYEKLVNNSGSRDYRNATLVMKKTMSNVIRYRANNDLKKIKVKTSLLWGIKDQETKFEEAKEMNKLLINSKIIPFYSSGHFCYIEEETKFIREVSLILKEVI